MKLFNQIVYWICYISYILMILILIIPDQLIWYFTNYDFLMPLLQQNMHKKISNFFINNKMQNNEHTHIHRTHRK